MEKSHIFCLIMQPKRLNNSMPIYTFYNSTTDQYTEDTMSYNDMKSLLKQNPNITHVLQPPKFADPSRMDATRGKPDDGFRDRLKEISKAHSGGLTKSTINTW